MNKERLNKLADVLDNLPTERPEVKFDMRYWRCGAVACAFGVACEIPEFKEAGLRLVAKDYGELVPKFRDDLGFDAACEFFDINPHQSATLFSPTSYCPGVTPQDVAERIREMINDTP